MRRGSTQIWSIYGQIEKAAAESMIDHGMGQRIEWDMMPPTQRYSETGERAYFAIVIPDEYYPEFEKRIRNLRA